MPAEGEQPLRFHLFDHDLNRRTFIRFLTFGYLGIHGRRYDYPAHTAPGREGPVELHAKPGPKLLGVGHRPPDPPGVKASSNFMPNQVPNSLELANPRQTHSNPP